MAYFLREAENARREIVGADGRPGWLSGILLNQFLPYLSNKIKNPGEESAFTVLLNELENWESFATREYWAGDIDFGTLTYDKEKGVILLTAGDLQQVAVAYLGSIRY